MKNQTAIANLKNAIINAINSICGLTAEWKEQRKEQVNLKIEQEQLSNLKGEKNKF